MSSLKMTFSLTSLILIFALGFAAMPVMAADGGPTVTIGTITGNRAADNTADPPETAITIEVTYSVPVTISDVTATDLKHTLQDGAGVTVGTAGQDAASVATIPATLVGSPTLHNKFLFTLPNITDTSARKVVVWVPADGVAGETPGGTAGPLNQASAFKTHTLPSLLSFTAALTAAQKKDAGGANIAGRFTVTLTVKKADDSAPTSAEVAPAPTVGDIMIMPMGAATAIDVSGAAITSTTAVLPDGTADDGIYTQDYQLGFGFSAPESVTLSLAAGYMGNTPSVKLPPAAPKDPVYQNPPTVSLVVVAHDADNRSFQISVTTTPADDTAGEDGKVIAGTAIKAELQKAGNIKDGSTPAANVPFKLLDGDAGNERATDNSYRAFLEYGPFDTLPLTVSIDPDELADPADPAATGVDPVTATVGEAGTTTPTPTDEDPSVAIMVSNYDAATRQFRVDVTITPGMKADGSAGDPITTAFGLSDLMITGKGDSAVTITTIDESFVAGTAASPAGVYMAILQYNPLAMLPLTITTADDFDTSDDPPTTAMVPPGTTTPTPPANAPATPAAPTAMENATNDLIIDVSWTAPADNGSAITGYTVKKYDSAGMLVKTFPDDDPNTTAITATSYMVGPVPAADRGKSFTFTVAATNANGTSAESPMSAAYTVPAAAPVTDITPPTVEITLLSKDADGKHMVDPGGTVRFELLFSEELAKAPSVSRLEVRDIMVYDHNGLRIPAADVTLSAAMPAPNNEESYTLTIQAPAPRLPLPINPPREPEREVHIEILTLGVADDATPKANPLGGTRASRMSMFDTIPPTVVITPGYFNASGVFVAAKTGEPMAKLAFEFDFSEPLSPDFSTTDIHRSIRGDNFTLEDDSDPQPVIGKADAFTVIVTPVDMDMPTTVLLKRLEISDAAKNQLQKDATATYTPTTQAPVALISARSPFNCGVTGNWVTITITDNEAIKAGESIAKSEITVSTGWKISADPRDYIASTAAKTATARFKVVRNDVESAADRTWLGIQEVTITIAADAVMDNTDQGNAAKSEKYTAGPVITIPAGAYVVVIRDNVYTWRYSHLNEVRTLYLGDYNVRADNIDVQGWDCMPDLGLIFDTTIDASPGIGGGGLMVLQSRDHDTTKPITKGTVGISEIMWSEDRGLPFGSASNLEHAREQWIELHNTNAFEVKVTLFDLIRTEAYRTNDASYDALGLVDVMSNYDIGERWNVQELKDDGSPKYGSDGNSDLGKDFISMKRVAPAADKNYAHGEKQGRNKGHWSASTSIYLTRRALLADRGIQLPLEDLNYSYFGSPGRANTFTAPGPITRTNLPKNLIFNEVANRRDQTLEWIELKNVSDAEINLKKYQISYVTAKGTDTLLYNFPDNDNIKLAAGEILLLLDTDPRDNDSHPIAVAFNRDGGNDQALGIGPDAIKYKVADFAEGGLPDDGQFVLILRNRNDRLKSHEGVLDAIGYDADLKDDAIFTNLWPLKYFSGTLDARNSVAVETVHRRQHVIDPDKNTHGDDKDEHQALRDVGYTGIGYKRHAQNTAAHGGSPGYDHGTRKNLVADVTAADPGGVLTISEIMYDQGDGRYPQWIEIYNSSNVPVNLHSEAGWRLIIENFDDGEIPVETLSGTLNFKNSEVQTILPQQTVMVTSTRARNSGSAFFDTRVIFPSTRVFSAWDDQRGELTRASDRGGRPSDPILSTKGFYIELIDGKGNFSDGVGNLIKSPNRRVAATIQWELSAVTGEMPDDMGRTSILRRYSEYKNGRLVGPYSAAQVEQMGVTAAGWRAAYKTDFRHVRQTWYGHPGDHGSPGITGGRVLPVSLSKFRPERLESGEIVVRWITESELNNAGFNILRSEKRDGEFTKVHFEAGKGTTSERSVYEWKDTTANKPNVVYFYQIQDVSLDGKVTTLRQSRLKGDITPTGKFTTTWGDIKALQ